MKSSPLLAAALLLGLLGAACRRERPAPPPPAPEAPGSPWSWHTLGGILVVEGELARPAELHLKGRWVDERRHVDLGPVRWELYAPPKGEVLTLCVDGRTVARWDLDAPPPEPQADAPPPTPPAPLAPAPRPAAPVPPPPAPPRSPRAAPPPPRKGPVAPPSRTPRKAPAPPVAPRPAPRPPSPAPAPSLPPQATVQARPANLVRGPKGGRRVALTFDGGSSAEVASEVLDALHARKLRCTLFLTGAFIRRFPDLVRRMDREGHELGNHTRSHPHLAPAGRRASAWTKARVQAELQEADRALQELTGHPMARLWRAPYGEHTPELRAWAEELGYVHVGWSEGADTLDWATPKERRIYRSGSAILDRLRGRMARADGDGLIVLMHLGSARPAADRPASGLGPFLDRAIAEGWRFVRVSEYLDGSREAPRRR